MRRAAHRVLWFCLALLVAVPAEARNCYCLKCLTPSYSSFYAQSEAMVPALPLDTCIVVRRFEDAPTRIEPGRIVVFAEGENAYVFRVVALAGQSVEMRGGRLWLDGVTVRTEPEGAYVQTFSPSADGLWPFCPTPVPPGQSCDIPMLREYLPNGVSYRVLDSRSDTSFDDTGTYLVPEGHVFVLGDNRDNALDSRASQAAGGRGFIRLRRIIGEVIEIDGFTAP